MGEIHHTAGAGGVDSEQTCLLFLFQSPCSPIANVFTSNLKTLAWTPVSRGLGSRRVIWTALESLIPQEEWDSRPRLLQVGWQGH